MDIIRANEVFQYTYRPPLKGTFDNKKVDNLVGEPCKRVSLKKAAKPQFTALVAARPLLR
jgi:hypothetical protein